MGLEMVGASGVYMWDVNGKQYIDLIAGFSVANIGHGNAEVIAAVQQQAAQYMHLIVYGEFIETPQVAYAKMLTDLLPPTLNSVYFTNSGAEATEGAMKLAKRVTGKPGMVACHNAYHGSTQGALSLMGSEYWRNAFRPLLPGVVHVPYNSQQAIDVINSQTAAIVVETVQAESGVTRPAKEWLQALRSKCNDTCTLLIFDEIQAGFGRTGSLWAFEQYDVVPDILLLGKALGGGMPLGAFVSSQRLMNTLTYEPVLGHITTFGGHPVSCAAGIAALKVLTQSNWAGEASAKQALFLQHLQHPLIKEVRSAGLWLAVAFDSFETNKQVIEYCIANGVITDWFLFAPHCLRIAPPLIITNEEIVRCCKVILEGIERARRNNEL